MNNIDIIEKLVSHDELFTAEVFCKDCEIEPLELLILLKKYMNKAKELQ